MAAPQAGVLQARVGLARVGQMPREAEVHLAALAATALAELRRAATGAAATVWAALAATAQAELPKPLRRQRFGWRHHYRRLRWKRDGRHRRSRWRQGRHRRHHARHGRCQTRRRSNGRHGRNHRRRRSRGERLSPSSPGEGGSLRPVRHLLLRGLRRERACPSILLERCLAGAHWGMQHHDVPELQPFSDHCLPCGTNLPGHIRQGPSLCHPDLWHRCGDARMRVRSGRKL